MITKVQKWGNSLGVRLPKALAMHADIREGMQVDVREENGVLMISPVEEATYSLEGLLASVTSANGHRAAAFGEASGVEGS